MHFAYIFMSIFEIKVLYFDSYLLKLVPQDPIDNKSSLITSLNGLQTITWTNNDTDREALVLREILR